MSAEDLQAIFKYVKNQNKEFTKENKTLKAKVVKLEVKVSELEMQIQNSYKFDEEGGEGGNDDVQFVGIKTTAKIAHAGRQEGIAHVCRYCARD